MDEEMLMEEVESSTTIEEETPEQNGNSLVENSEETVETPEETVEPPKPEPIENSKAFSERLKKARAKDTQRIKELEEKQNGYNALLEALGQYGYGGNALEIADALTASARQTTPEQAKAEREAREKAIEDTISNHPLIRQAQEVIENSEKARVQAMLNEDLRVIRQLDPTIKEITDLNKHPQASIIHALVQSGMTYSQAFKQIHDLTHEKAKPKQDTKSHLKGMGGGDSNGTNSLYEIPKDELGFYQESFPNDTYAQLRERYNRILKRQKGE